MASSMSSRSMNNGYNNNNRRQNGNGYGGNGNRNQQFGNGRRGRQGNNGYGAQTPLVGVQTPAHSGYGGGAETPAFGSHTPAMGGQTPGYGGVTPAYGGGSTVGSAWNVGGATPGVGGYTPAMGAQTPLSPAYDPQAQSHSTYSHNSMQATTPSYDYQNSNSNNYNHQNQEDVNGHGHSQSNSESEQGDQYEQATLQDPYYFVVEHALLSYQGEDVVIQSVDRNAGVCSVLIQSRGERLDGVSIADIQHTVVCDSSAKCKVVWGKLRGEVGSLIGIDNDEAVVQLQSTTEVTIINKKLVVVYIEP